MPTVTFKPASGTGYDFEDKFVPVVTKNEWGIDVLPREMWGAQPGLVTFMEGLTQGATYSWNGNTFYLQSWSCDDDEVYPTVTLVYKGLNDGIPDPYVSGKTITQTGVISCTSPSSASRSFTYVTRQSAYRYIASSRPASPTYTSLDVDISPVIIKSAVNNADGTVYLGDVPSDLLTALTPVGSTDEAFMECEPVFGSPFFECIDTVTRLLPSNGGS